VVSSFDARARFSGPSPSEGYKKDSKKVRIFGDLKITKFDFFFRVHFRRLFRLL